jgi:hypothetical protein
MRKIHPRRRDGESACTACGAGLFDAAVVDAVLVDLVIVDPTLVDPTLVDPTLDDSPLFGPAVFGSSLFAARLAAPGFPGVAGLIAGRAPAGGFEGGVEGRSSSAPGSLANW